MWVQNVDGAYEYIFMKNNLEKTNRGNGKKIPDDTKRGAERRPRGQKMSLDDVQNVLDAERFQIDGEKTLETRCYPRAQPMMIRV